MTSAFIRGTLQVAAVNGATLSTLGAVDELPLPEKQQNAGSDFERDAEPRDVSARPRVREHFVARALLVFLAIVLAGTTTAQSVQPLGIALENCQYPYS